MSSIPSSIPDSQRTLISTVMACHGYEELTKTQQEAFADGVLDGGNWLLVAETGNGKTLVGECRVRQRIDAGETIEYLVPSHRLVEEKAADLRTSSPESARISTDPRDEEATVLVRTFDSFFRSLLSDTGQVDTLDHVILDDFHEIYSASRGPGIEKAITAILEADVSLFAMSATIGNPDHIAQWLDAELTLSSQRRGVPIEEHPVAIDDSYPSRGAQIAELIRQHDSKSPYLVFCHSRRNCEARARAVADSDVVAQTPDSDIGATVEQLLNTKLTRRYRELIELIENGVAYHHAGLDRGVQDFITELVHDEAISAVFCTPTLAYGFDAPIKSVIVADLKRWTGQAMEYVAMYEYVQWIGRAGRLGYGYDVGYAFPMYKSFEEANDQFEFDRDTSEKSLEAVTSHLDSTNEFRVFLLELIGAGWSTQTEIESFLEATFYWEQLQISARKLDQWGMDTSDPAERMRRELGKTASWLVDQALLEQRADASFAVTPLGEAMTRFIHDTWGRYTVANSLAFLDWLRTREEVHAIELLREVIDTFELELGETVVDESFKNELVGRGLGTDEVAHTVGVLAWYWCSGVDITTIEQELDIDAGYLPSIAQQLDDILGSIARFFSPLGLAEPEWYETLRLQLRYGVSAETVRLVSAVDGIGRVRVTNLQEGLKTLERERDEDYGKGSVSERLLTFQEIAANGDETLFEDVLAERSTFSGIGPTLAGRLTAALPLAPPETTSRPFSARPKDTP